MATTTSPNGSEKVFNLAERKEELMRAGGTVLDMAIAMLETKHMSARDYPVGDIYRLGMLGCGMAKTEDAANFGIFKQNWMMIRRSWSAYAAKGPGDYMLGEALNKSLRHDVNVLHACQSKFGFPTDWYFGHRLGESGLLNKSDPKISANVMEYRMAVEWIYDKLTSNSKYQMDDTRFWVDVRAI